MRGMLPIALTCALAACAGNGSHALPSGGGVPMNGAAMRTIAAHSWMNHAAASGALLYLSDYGSSQVYVYTWPTLQLVGTLTGFNHQWGECVDAAGDVWIAGYKASNLVEYAHGGTSPIATLDDAGNYPVSCAINNRTGALAAGNLSTTSNGPGSVEIYKHATGTGTNYVDPNIPYVEYLGYDPTGKLFLDGYDASFTFTMAAFKRGTFTTVTLNGATITTPGGVQYAKGSLTVGDQNGPTYPYKAIIYQITETGTVTGKTVLSSTPDCVQYFIHRKIVICPNSGGPNWQVYKYPAGGVPTKTISGSFGDPAGAVISR